MSGKSFMKYVLALVLGMALFQILFWHMCAKEVFYGHDNHGDLARMEMLPVAPALTKNVPYGGSHTEFAAYLQGGQDEHYDVVTIGDSMSAGTGGAYYQDYLAEKTGLSVLNVIRLNRSSNPYDVCQMIRLLIDFGYFDRIKPRYVILECGERMVGRHFASEFLPLPRIDRETFEKEYLAYKELGSKDIVPEGTLISTTMAAANKIYLENMFRGEGEGPREGSLVRKAHLSVPAFSNPGQENLLLHFSEDRTYLFNPPEAGAVNDTVNNLARELADRGIKLIFLVVPDKSDLYYPYIDSEKPERENSFYEDMLPLPKEYEFPDAKAILRRELGKGEQDIYWCDDTHWSQKGQRAVVEALLPLLEKWEAVEQK